MLKAHDFKGVYSIMPTPYAPVEGVWNGQNTLDHEETARLTEALIADGSAGILALGTTGENATVTEEEFRDFTRIVVDTAGKRVPVFIGCTMMGTHETLNRLRFARDAGADGTLLGLPMWQPCSEDMAVAFYGAVSDALPDFPIMVYANPGAFRFDFPPSFFARVAERAPTVTSAKFMNPRSYLECLRVAGDRINFLPFPEVVGQYVDMAPDRVTAIWATSASMGPRAIVRMMRALADGDTDLFRRIAADTMWAGAPIMKPDGIIPAGDFQTYNIQFEKERFTASGYCRPGPARPPYGMMPENYAEDARENARRWNEVLARYADA